MEGQQYSREQTEQLRSSRYNVLVPLGDGAGAVYNRRTGSCVSFPPDVYTRVEAFLTSSSSELSLLGDSTSAPEVAAHLIVGGFAVTRSFDELEALRTRYKNARRNPALKLTVYTTYNYNLACDYCIVGSKKGPMSAETEALLLRFVDSHFKKQATSSMTVDWFGGEPLLATGLIERLSGNFRHLCQENGASYRAQLITNGTLITEALAARIPSWGVDQIQITLDGLRDVHDSRRRWKQLGRSSFDDIVRALRLLVGKFIVRLRVNVDRRNAGEVSGLLDLFEREGWLNAHSRFYPYVARVGDYTEDSAWVDQVMCSQDEIQCLQEEWLERLHACNVPVLMQPLYGFPECRATTCGAVSSNTFLVTPNGRLHKCGFDADDDARPVGSLGQTMDPDDPAARYWRDFDPFASAECRSCEALPSCMGFCPRNRRDGRVRLAAEYCAYFHEHERRAIAKHIQLQHRRS